MFTSVDKYAISTQKRTVYSGKPAKVALTDWIKDITGQKTYWKWFVTPRDM